ncbi:MAG: glycosyltransferase family 4 protein [bacterium]|nr:glycosyltransferase family 4 protein [bacterium]
MKILHVTNTVAAGGAEVTLLALCRHHKAAGVDLTVACLREHVPDTGSLRPEFERAGIVVRDLDCARFDPRCPWTLHGLIREERPDILHTHLPRADIAGIVARGRKPIPRVVTVHGTYGTQGMWRYLKPALAGVWRRADAVLATSGAVSTWLVQSCGLPSESVRVVYNGIDVESFASARRDLRAEWGMEERPVIGTVGRLEPGKGHDLLVQGMPRVLREFPNAVLLIAGVGSAAYGRALANLIHDLGLREHVRLVGFQEDVPSFLHSVDVFASGSRSEGFGLAVAEAMAAGKPVVAAHIPPLDEIVEDGETGLLVGPESPDAFGRAIVALLRDPATAERMGTGGRSRVAERFTASRMAADVLRIYSRLLEETA